jgi:hypothetical protein
MFASMSDDELIQRSDLIVIGEWVGQSSLQWSNTTARIELGAVSIGEVLKGPAGLTLALVAAPLSGGPRSGADVIYRRGDRGLWLLRARPGMNSGVYLADHPQRFVAEGSGSGRIDALRKKLPRR